MGSSLHAGRLAGIDEATPRDVAAMLAALESVCASLTSELDPVVRERLEHAGEELLASGAPVTEGLLQNAVRGGSLRLVELIAQKSPGGVVWSGAVGALRQYLEVRELKSQVVQDVEQQQSLAAEEEAGVRSTLQVHR